ncbi:ABC transporter ATP-binding protein [bacterium]|nr:ABC transporter ATP-binding protein [bacterium]
MFYRISKLAEHYYDWWLKITGLGANMKLRQIDFEKPWWTVVTKRWLLWLVILSGRIAATAFVTSIPMLIGIIIQRQNAYLFFLLSVVWAVVELWRYVTIYLFDVEQGSISYGVQQSAYRFFLTVDPIYHSMRTSGHLFAKVERGARAYEDILNNIIYELLPIVIGILTVIVSFFALNFKIGLMAFSFLLILSLFNIFTTLFNALAFEKKLIEADDEVKAISMESLTRIELVRSSFASQELFDSMHQKNKFCGATLAVGWLSFGTVMLFTRIAYGISICLLGSYVLLLVKNETITALTGTSFLLTYLYGSYKIMRIGHRAQKLMRYLIRIRDIFSFIKKFGLQTFPVLSDEISEAEVPLVKKITIKAENLEFSYTKKAQIFDEHTLVLTVEKKQKNKLYGIIGPSGIGKTTLISILGGQLRPTAGSVEINNVKMYEVNDDVRKQLVVMQGQTASSLSGTVRDSLLLGLPKDRDLFPDEKLIDLLHRVGVWMIFEQKEGLESSVGEGGLNLSVGQRQRLNFASLYLRTNHFKPSLILIDEPTSSLDEVSELAITDMIDELAQHAITFVIAHRLNTLEKAVGILDVSLLIKEKKLQFHAREDLMHKSEYYKKLMRGEVTIGE